MFCQECGKPVPDDIRFCPYCGYNMGRAAPDTHLPPDIPAVQTTGQQPYLSPAYAGFWERFAAWIIDIIIVYVILFCIGVAIGVLIAGGLITMGNYSLYEYDRIAESLNNPMVLLGIVIFILYFAYLESSKNQATFGKKALKIKVIDTGGSRLTFGRAVARTICKIFSAIILGLGLIIIGFTEKKQGLHDMIMSTYVLKV
jgi:uncharacterized RDD family membrane protein YckC